MEYRKSPRSQRLLPRTAPMMHRWRPPCWFWEVRSSCYPQSCRSQLKVVRKLPRRQTGAEVSPPEGTIPFQQLVERLPDAAVAAGLKPPITTTEADYLP